MSESAADSTATGNEPPRTHSPNSQKGKNPETGLAEATISDLIKELTGKRPDYVVLGTLVSYVETNQIRVPHFCQFLRDKRSDLVQRGYPITSLKLFETVCDDFPLWRSGHAEQIEREARFEDARPPAVEMSGRPQSEIDAEIEALRRELNEGQPNTQARKAGQS